MRVRAVVWGVVATVAGLAVAVVASLMVLLSTGPGHALVRRYAVRAIAAQLEGSVEIGAMGGPLWRVADLRDVVVADSSGALVLRAARVRVGYRVLDLLRGRFVLRNVELDRPIVVLAQRPDGTWNYQHVLRLLDSTRAAPSSRPLVDLRGLRVVDGTLILRRRPTPDSVDARTFDSLALDLSRLRLSDPDSTAIVAQFARLAGRLDRPALALSRGEGTVVVEGPGAALKLDHLVIGRGTDAAVAGRIGWGGIHTTAELSLSAQPIVFADLRGALPELPVLGGGRLGARLELLPSGAEALDIRYAEIQSGRSRVQGSARVAVDSVGRLTLGASTVRLSPLDLASLAPYVSSLPVHGLVAGRLTAHGAPSDLTVDADLSLRDEFAGAPDAVSRVVATGRIGVGAPEGVVARDLVVSRADLSLATLGRLARGVPAEGRVRVAGTFDGPWRAPSVSTLVLAFDDGTSPATVARGHARFDARRVMDAQLTFDTLAFAQVARLAGAWPAHGGAAGTLEAHGPLDSLAFAVALRGPAGAVAAHGVLGLLDSAVTLTAAGTLDSVDVSRVRADLPARAVSGRWSVALRATPADSGRRRLGGRARLALDSVQVAGVTFRRAGAAVALDSQQIVVDSAWAQRPDLRVLLTGAIGRPGEGARQLTFAARADTVERLAPLLRWLRRFTTGDSAAADSMALPEGDLRANGRVVGTLAQYEVDATIAATALSYDSAGATNLLVQVEASPRLARPRFDVQVRADSVWRGGLAYGGVSGAARGNVDTLAARVSARFGRRSSLAAAVRVARDSTRLLAHVDTLDLSLAGRPWGLTAPFSVTVSPAAVTVERAELRAVGGPGLVRASGALPRETPGAFVLTADSVPLAGLYALAQRDTAGVGGDIAAALRVTGSRDAPVMDLTVSLADGRIGDYHAPLLRLAGRYEGRQLTIDGGLWRDTVRVLDIAASLPLDLALVAVPERRVAGEYSVRLRADSVDLGLLGQVSDAITNPGGRLVADLRVTGTWGGARHAEGSLEVVDGAATVPALGRRYTGIDARLALADSVITLTRARLVSGGTADVSGAVTLQPFGPARLDLAVHADHFDAIDMRRFAGVTASGDFTLQGPVFGALLRGGVTVDRGYLMFADLVEKRIVNLDDPEFRAIVDSALAAAPQLAPSAVTVFLDSVRVSAFAVRMGSDVWLRSTEANIQLTGAFQVSRTIEGGAPLYRLDGTLNANRGTYRLDLGGVVSTEFRVTHGDVRFFGTPDFNPELDITAEHTVRTPDNGQFNVQVVLTGTLLTPQLHLTSDQRPPLSETEIVSYLMFGRPTNELTGGNGGVGGQQQLLNSALSSLASVSAGLFEQSLVSDFGLPIDYLTIRPGVGTSQADLLSSARIEAGKQLSSRTFLTLSAGLCEVRQGTASGLFPGVGLEYTLSGHWSLESSYEPIVRQCNTSFTSQLANINTNYQLGFDLFWQTGIR